MKKRKLKIKVFTVQFKFEILNSSEPTVGIQTTLIFYLTDNRTIVRTEDCCRFCSEYKWTGKLSKEEKHKLTLLIESDLVIERVNDLKNKFLMDKINNIESELYIHKEEMDVIDKS